MKITDFKGKKITVMGLGLNGGGVGITRFLSENGARVIATDLKEESELGFSLEKLKNVENVEYVFGGHRDEDFLKADMVIKNPGVPWTNRYIQLALENNIPVEIDSSLFFKLCKNKIIGVTGTRGKTTTSSLIFNILEKAGKNPVKVGIGQVSVLDQLSELEPDSWVVFELSSWRLSALGKYQLSPHVAVFTNIFQDHLNYYKNLEEYLADKEYIFSNQKETDFCVINEDNETLRELEPKIKSQIIKFSDKEIGKGNAVYLSNDDICARDRDRVEKIMSKNEIKIPGEHNVKNVLASIGATKFIGIENEFIREGIASFVGLPHHLELVRNFQGVRYYNDSTATSPDGAISGINSFDEPLVLIAGGSDKKLSMKELAEAIAGKIHKLVFLKGEGTDKIIQELKNMGKEDDFIIADSMDEAVWQARKLSSEGDVVLLSPGTASFGLFLNEFDRGDKFKKAVNDLR
ncbi:MAG: hypothetical protein ACD_15C00027G0027 [uncultured bacterium]|nr:MAG: hypothetical protein ACD_15C00027G0027 [uncultured bacterium]HCU70150.1 UDP-N-acetylmuramoyl-L-alanine--D-glutamate ligase [Candidatus Moranbacteria bacterium]